MSGLFVYVDDEPILCRLFELNFQDAQLPARSFTDPEAALAFIDETPNVRAVLCDYRMPALNGLEFLARMTRDVPFYLVTGDHSFKDEEAELNPRVTKVVEKPFRYGPLLAELRALLD